MILKRNELLSVMRLMAKVVPSRSTLPILSHVLFDGPLVRATDLEISLEIELPDEAGRFAAPCKLLTEVLTSLPDDLIDIQHDNNKLRMKTGNYKTSMATMPADAS